MWKGCLIIGVLYSFASSHCQGQVGSGPMPPNASSVRLQIEAPFGRSVYRIGEAVPLQLVFSTSGPPQFRLQPFPSSRRAGSAPDVITVEPQSGWDDPLGGFFRSCPIMFTGGLYDAPTLTNNPIKVPLILNDWVRFQRAGDYYLTVRSNRVIAIDTFPNMPQPSLEARFSLHIDAASKDWQSQTLDDAMKVLNSIKSDSSELSQQQERRTALNAVRFLGTEEAAYAMVRLLASEPYSYELLAGIVGSPARNTVETEMRRLLVDPRFPVVREFLCALAIVTGPPGTDNLTSSRKTELEARFREELRVALPKKIGQARVISSVTIDSQP
jgi:hypothetical protein